MGWTWQCAKFYDRKGNIDRKAECDDLYTWNNVSVPLRGVGCFGKAAHSFWCNRKKNCQLCYFIVSYWQMVYQ